MSDQKATGLALLREPFTGDQISKKPIPLRWMTDAINNKTAKSIFCEICGGWHHEKAAHLDYVGHAALTSRLLDADPEWNWEPVAKNPDGTPAINGGGMWINLTVCGVTRLGYGDADGKSGGNATKEVIGDALRNAAMRFGAALDLWHKGDLHAADDNDDDAAREKEKQPPPQPPEQPPQQKQYDPHAALKSLEGTLFDTKDIECWWAETKDARMTLKKADPQKYGVLEDRVKSRRAFLAQSPNEGPTDGSLVEQDSSKKLEDIPF